MFFFVSKVLGFFAAPSNLVMSLGLIGLLLLPTRFARGGWWLAAGSLVVLAMLGFSPIGNALIIPLQQRFPPWDAASAGPAPDRIILLGAATSPPSSPAPTHPPPNTTASRITDIPH